MFWSFSPTSSISVGVQSHGLGVVYSRVQNMLLGSVRFVMDWGTQSRRDSSAGWAEREMKSLTRWPKSPKPAVPWRSRGAEPTGKEELGCPETCSPGTSMHGRGLRTTSDGPSHTCEKISPLIASIWPVQEAVESAWFFLPEVETAKLFGCWTSHPPLLQGMRLDHWRWYNPSSHVTWTRRGRTKD